jgi:uncharacterized membrane protein YesL
MGFYKEHFAEITLIWLSVFLIGIVIGLGYYPLADKDTVAWIRSVAGGFTYALLLALKLKTGVSSDTQTTNTNVTTTQVDKTVGKEEIK